MKNVKRFVAIIAAALMIGAVVPTTVAFAEETKQEAVQQVALTQTAVSQDSMTISWADEEAENSTYVVMIFSTKASAPSYGSTRTFVKNVEYTNSVEFTGLEANMPYDVVVYKTDKVKGNVTVLAQATLSTLA